MPSPNYTPILNRAAGTAHVPVLRHPGFVVFDLETFEALQHRPDVLMSPLRLGTDHGRPAIRAKNLQPTEGSSGSHCVADLVMRPGAFQVVAYRDGNPWNLRASNLYTVPRPGMLADSQNTGPRRFKLIPPEVIEDALQNCMHSRATAALALDSDGTA